MKPIDQTQFYEEGVSTGNCQQAAVASLLGLELHEVPNFNEQGDGQFWPSFWKFLKCRGLVCIELSGNRHFGLYHLAYGPSPRGVSHAVIYQEGKLAHDPHPSRAGILSVETTALIVPANLMEWSRCFMPGMMS